MSHWDPGLYEPRDAPQALALRHEPNANVERYETLRLKGLARVS